MPKKTGPEHAQNGISPSAPDRSKGAAFNLFRGLLLSTLMACNPKLEGAEAPTPAPLTQAQGPFIGEGSELKNRLYAQYKDASIREIKEALKSGSIPSEQKYLVPYILQERHQKEIHMEDPLLVDSEGEDIVIKAGLEINGAEPVEGLYTFKADGTYEVKVAQ